MDNITIVDSQNSFVVFNEQNYLTQRDCGIVKPFCLPINSGEDLVFQFRTVELVPTTLEWHLVVNGVEKAYVDYPTVTRALISTGNYLYYVDYSTCVTLFATLAEGDCFQLMAKFIGESEDEYSFTTQTCFQYVSDTCFTSKLKYKNDEDAFGFDYTNIEDAWNIIRLPIYFRNPQPKNDQKVYLRSDGTRTKLYAKLSKQYEALVDYTTEEVHQKLVVALSHDSVNFVTDNNYELECTFEDEYNQEFPSVMQGINIWNAKFNVMETPFDEQNNNCI